MSMCDRWCPVAHRDREVGAPLEQEFDQRTIAAANVEDMCVPGDRAVELFGNRAKVYENAAINLTDRHGVPTQYFARELTWRH